jgi:hypothetical protein
MPKKHAQFISGIDKKLYLPSSLPVASPAGSKIVQGELVRALSNL